MKDCFNIAVESQMQTRKAEPGRVVPPLALLSLGGGLQMATQFFAGQFRYQAAPSRTSPGLIQPSASFIAPPNGTLTIQTPIAGPVAPAMCWRASACLVWWLPKC
jgi:hypothetical protein